jgi:hypothetical protein
MTRYLEGLTAAGKFSGTVLVAGRGQVLIDTGTAWPTAPPRRRTVPAPSSRSAR